MAFNFDAKADSSDDESPGIDLAAWKTGAAPAARAATNNAPIAPMVAYSQDGRASSSPSLSGFGLGRDHPRTASPPPATPKPSIGFRPINRSPPRASTQSTRSSEKESSPEEQIEVEQPMRRGKGKNVSSVVSGHKRKLVVRISRREADTSNVEDYTGGSDRVKRVLEEKQDDDGTVFYRVQFADYHDEEVCSIPLPAAHLLYGVPFAVALLFTNRRFV
jgi:hypothetical protein